MMAIIAQKTVIPRASGRVYGRVCCHGSCNRNFLIESDPVIYVTVSTGHPYLAEVSLEDGAVKERSAILRMGKSLPSTPTDAALW